MTEQMLRITAEHTGQSVEQIDHDSLRDRWFTAEEAREYGFVDEVLNDVQSVTPVQQRSVAFGLSAAGGAR